MLSLSSGNKLRQDFRDVSIESSIIAHILVNGSVENFLVSNTPQSISPSEALSSRLLFRPVDEKRKEREWKSQKRKEMKE